MIGTRSARHAPPTSLVWKCCNVPSRNPSSGRGPFSLSIAVCAAGSASRALVGIHWRTVTNASRVPSPEWQQSSIATTCAPRPTTSSSSRPSSLSASGHTNLPRVSCPASNSSRFCILPDASPNANSVGGSSWLPWPEYANSAMSPLPAWARCDRKPATTPSLVACTIGQGDDVGGVAQTAAQVLLRGAACR